MKQARPVGLQGFKDIFYSECFNHMRQLEPDIQKIWTAKYGFLGSIAVLASVVYELLRFFDGRPALGFPGVLFGAILLGAILLTIFLPRLQYRFWRFDLRAEELYLERGVVNRIKTIVPLRRIQHLDVSQNILEREFSLSKLIVHTAGSRSSDVVLPGLKLDEAEQLRDDVKRYILEDAV